MGHWPNGIMIHLFVCFSPSWSLASFICFVHSLSTTGISAVTAKSLGRTGSPVLFDQRWAPGAALHCLNLGSLQVHQEVILRLNWHANAIHTKVIGSVPRQHTQKKHALLYQLYYTNYTILCYQYYTIRYSTYTILCKQLQWIKARFECMWM